VVASAFSIAMLNNCSDIAAEHERELNHLQAVANRLDALEWRAISKKRVDSELEKALKQQRDQAQRSRSILTKTAPSIEQMQKVELAYKNYATAVDRLLKLLEFSRIQEALEFDETQVDPSYDKLYQIIVNATTEASQTSANFTYWANIGSVLIVLFLVGTLGIVFRQYLRANQKVQNLILENMRDREKSLEKEHQILEARVTERTQELQKANTALSQAISDLQQSQMQLVQSEKMSMLGQLVAGVGHEINNPVSFLSGNIQPALDYLNDLLSLIDIYQGEFPQLKSEIQQQIDAIDLDYIREDFPKLINSMREGVIRIQDISTSLRTFSRSDSASPVEFNLHDGIDSTLMILKYRLKANETRPAIKIIKEYGKIPMVECYVGQLNQVFMNLLSNAIDGLEELNQNHSFAEIESYGNCILIKTRLSDDGQFVVISIKDNGVGMTEEVKEKIFDNFFTTKPVNKGTGLGLAISYSIVVERHGGTLEVNSSLGNGAEFVMTIPVKGNGEWVMDNGY
ncbi:MAG: sensor histidine kinase, partial [Microcoleaceae cyanobacterium]